MGSYWGIVTVVKRAVRRLDAQQGNTGISADVAGPEVPAVAVRARDFFDGPFR